MNSDERTYLNKTKLKERGWTDTIIKNFLGVPDDEQPNTLYEKGPSIKLYCLKRVKQTEKTDAFADAQIKAAARRAKLAKSRKLKGTNKRDYTGESRELAEKVEIDLGRKLAEKGLLTATTNLHNKRVDVHNQKLFDLGFKEWDRPEEYGHDGSFRRRIDKKVGPALLRRLQVNFLLYDRAKCDGVPWKDWAQATKKKKIRAKSRYRKMVLVRVLDAITQKYPQLKQECDKRRRELIKTWTAQ